jgi:hypothetical protein
MPNSSERSPWDFGSVYELLDNLSTADATPIDHAKSNTHRRGSSVSTRQSTGLGDLGPVWQFLYASRDKPLDSTITIASPPQAPSSIDPFLQRTLDATTLPPPIKEQTYNSDGAADTSERKNVTWKDEPEMLELSDESNSPPTPTAPMFESTAGNPISSKQQKKLWRDLEEQGLMSRRQLVQEKIKYRAARKKQVQRSKHPVRKTRSDVESESEIRILKRPTPAKKASVHVHSRPGTPKDETSTTPKHSHIEHQKTQKGKSRGKGSEERNEDENLAEVHAISDGVISDEPSSAAVADDENVPKDGKRHWLTGKSSRTATTINRGERVKGAATPAASDTEQPIKLVEEKPKSKVAVPPALYPSSIVRRLAPSVANGATVSNSQRPVTPIAPKDNNGPAALTVQPLPQNKPKKMMNSPPKYLEALSLERNRPVNNTAPLSNPTFGFSPPHHSLLPTVPSIHPSTAYLQPYLHPSSVTLTDPLSQKLKLPFNILSKEDRDLHLFLRLVHEFPADKKWLTKPVHLAGHAASPTGIHVFVDFSNIWIMFMEHLKLKQLQLKQQIPHQNISFDSLVLILERRRPVSKRVMAGSYPLLPAMELAKAVGYETNILDKVYKVRDVPERQRRMQYRNFLARGNPAPVLAGVDSVTAGGASNGGSSSGSGTRVPTSAIAGNTSAGATNNTVTGPSNTAPSTAGAPFQFIPEKWVEQGVDEVLHLKMLESIVDTDEPSTMVVATGDAAQAEYSGGFMKMITRALKKGWKVELVAWTKSISSEYRRQPFVGQWVPSGQFRIIELDEYAEYLLDT